MGIRLVSDNGSAFEVTGFSWNRMLRFASENGWRVDSRLAPADRWNGEYEPTAGARLDSEAARLLADAIESGTDTHLLPAFLMEELEMMGDVIDDPAEHACNLMAEWKQFAVFARKQGFRVDF